MAFGAFIQDNRTIKLRKACGVTATTVWIDCVGDWRVVVERRSPGANWYVMTAKRGGARPLVPYLEA